MDRLKLLEAFVKVAETGSISRAAAALRVSKSVVSQRVSQLEDAIGRILLHRTTRRISLTEAGSDAYPACADIVARVRDLENSLRDAPGSLSGRLRVAAAIDIGVSELAAAASEFYRLHNQLDVEIIASDSAVSPADDGFDFTLHYRKLSDPRLVQHRVGSIGTGLYAAPAYLDRAGEPSDPDALGAHDCLGYSQQVTVNDWDATQWTFLRPGETRRAEVRLKARSNSGLVLRRFAEDGLGLAVLPHRRAREAVQAGRLRRVLPDWRAPTLELFASCARAQADTLKMKAFVSFLGSHFAGEDAAGGAGPAPS